MGGSLNIESELQPGTHVTCMLPLAIAPAPAAVTSISAESITPLQVCT